MDNKYIKTAVIVFAMGLLLLFLMMLFEPRIIGTVWFRDGEDYFMDFFNVIGFSLLKDPYTSYYQNDNFIVGTSYSAFCLLLVRPFAVFGNYSLLFGLDMNSIEWRYTLYSFRSTLMILTHLAFMAPFYLALFCLLNKVANTKDRLFQLLIFIISFFSMPIIFNYHRGNLIIIAAVAIIFFFLYYNSFNKKLRILALFCLALATTLKLTPILAMIILVKKRRFQDIFIVFIFGCLLMIVPFFFYERPLNMIYQFILNLFLFSAESTYLPFLSLVIYSTVLIFIVLAFKAKSDDKTIEYSLLAFTTVNGFGYNYILIYLLYLFVKLLKMGITTTYDYLYYGLFLVMLVVYPNFYVFEFFSFLFVVSQTAYVIFVLLKVYQGINAEFSAKITI